MIQYSLIFTEVGKLLASTRIIIYNLKNLIYQLIFRIYSFYM